MALLETTILYKGTPLKITGDQAALVTLINAQSSGLATETTLNAVGTKLSSVVVTPNLIRTTGAGTIAPAIYDFSVFNAGLADGVFLGATIRPGETFSYAAGALNNIYAAGTIAYDATGTELIIAYNS